MLSLKLYGERNSGTNYLEQLLITNLNAHVLKFSPNRVQLLALKTIKYDSVQDLIHYANRKKHLGWKHGCPRIAEINRYTHPLMIVTITKNPYSFLLSLHKFPYHYKGEANPDFFTFIKQSWGLRKRDNISAKNVQTPIHLWNLKNKSYFNLGKHVQTKVINLTYEALLLSPENVINEIVLKYPELKKSDVFNNVLNSTKSSEKTFDSYKDYYLNEHWKDELSSEHIHFINSHLDREVVESFGYAILE